MAVAAAMLQGMRPWLLAVLLLGACHRKADVPAPGQRGAPLNVAAAVAGCDGLADCDRTCADGNGAACVEAGRLYEFGHAGARDAARAYGLYERSCLLGSAAGCYNQALLLETGKGVGADKKRASALYERVCQMGSKSACARGEELGGAP